MSWDPDALQFYCFGCGMKIDLYGYYKDHLGIIAHEESSKGRVSRRNGLTKRKTSLQKNRDAIH